VTGPDLLEGKRDLSVYGDNAYMIHPEERQQLKQEQNVRLYAPPRSNMNQKGRQIPTREKRAWRKLRQRVEGAFNHLDDLFKLESTMATVFDSVAACTHFKLAAYLTAAALNQLMGRPLLSMRSLLP
jgi:hypothetical protein